MRRLCRGLVVCCASALLGACEEGTMYRSTLPPGTFSPVTVAGTTTPATGAYGFVETFDDARFATSVVASAKPVLVDCWAPWCGPCRGMEPTVNELAREWGGTIRVGKLDVTTSPAAAKRYGVSALPAFLVFRNGVVVQRVVGYQSKENLKRMVEAAAR